MKKILVVLVIWCFVLFACAAPRMVGPNAAKGWSRFIGQKVTDVNRVAYPDGDVPRNLIKMKSGESRIY